MAVVYWPNMTFEDELELPGTAVPKQAQKLVSELAPVMGLLAQDGLDVPGDEPRIVLVAPDCRPQGLPETLRHVVFETLSTLQARAQRCSEFQPWGWSSEAISIARLLKVSQPIPDAEIVKSVNSRQFLSVLDECVPLADVGGKQVERGGTLCWSMLEVEAALEEFRQQGYREWVIKANFSQAARSRMLGSGMALEASQCSWLRKRIDRGQPVYAEPWVTRLAECGLQFVVPPSSGPSTDVQFVGACEMLTDAAGRYRGSIIQSTGLDKSTGWWAVAKDRCQRIAERARDMGFFGPLGMDCMLYRHPGSGKPWLRCCHDVNGRLTMGRVALSLRRWLQPGETGFWCHLSTRSGAGFMDLFDAMNVKDVRIVPTSPAVIGTQSPDLQTALLISDDCEKLTQVVRKIVSQDIRGPYQAAEAEAKAEAE